MHLRARVSSSSSIPGPRFPSGIRVGDYTIESEYSVEDTGVVYLATHVVLPRRVWLKVMHGGEHGDREMAVQMLREACLLEALAHPGIPRVFECGRLADRRPWIAVERIEGESLMQLLLDGPMPVADLVVVLRDVAELLGYVHARGVVHRALTADAILRTPDRSFGVCVRHWSEARASDAEQAIDPRDDVYALGMIAFRALTGCLHTPSVTASEWCPAAPVELSSLIDEMLHPEREHRPASEDVRDRARWLASDFEQLKIDKPRWTPPHGLDPDKLPVLEGTSDFTIRISRTPTR